MSDVFRSKEDLYSLSNSSHFLTEISPRDISSFSSTLPRVTGKSKSDHHSAMIASADVLKQIACLA